MPLLAIAVVAGVVLAKARRRAGFRSRPLYAACYGVFARRAERGELGRRRQWLLGHSSGLVLEIGAGSGENFKHLPPAARRLVAVEPDAVMSRLARRRLPDARVPTTLVRAVVEDLPFRDATFDSAVVTLVLCTVGDPGRAVAELRRVLRPGGRLLLLEHVRSRDELVAVWQDRLERPWAWLNGGCRPNRPTLATVGTGGFRIDDVRPYGPDALPHVQAIAVRKDDE